MEVRRREVIDPNGEGSVDAVLIDFEPGEILNDPAFAGSIVLPSHIAATLGGKLLEITEEKENRHD